MKFINFLDDCSSNDISLVGGKASSLAFMIQKLNNYNINVPLGFVLNTNAYKEIIKYNQLESLISKNLNIINQHNNKKLIEDFSSYIFNIIKSLKFQEYIINEIEDAYNILSSKYSENNLKVAVRSSAKCEDLINNSFAGLYDSFLNISGIDLIIESIKLCIASLFSERAILYRKINNIAIEDTLIAVIIQKMVNSDKSVSGTIFTSDLNTGFKDSIVINSSYGLGQNIVSGNINPDEFYISKTILKNGFYPIVKKLLGDKQNILILNKENIYKDKDINKLTKNIKTTKKLKNEFSLKDSEIVELANISLKIEEKYNKNLNNDIFYDIEWAKDYLDNKFYILQVRPATALNNNLNQCKIDYKLKNSDKKPILTGLSLYKKILSNNVSIITNLKDKSKFKDGNILVTDSTSPDWVPLISKASGLITNKGGRTCHAAIISRELSIPAILGTKKATSILYDNQLITIDTTKDIGYIYDGLVEYEEKYINFKYNIQLNSPVKLLINISDPIQAYKYANLPVSGVGLARIEFIIANSIFFHPMAIFEYNKLSKNLRTKIESLAKGYNSLYEYYIDKLAKSIALISSAFYPKDVFIRFSDFKSNEYRSLLGGYIFEPKEENPMIGFRGSFRYLHPRYKEAFLLECKAIKYIRDKMGLTNTHLIIPFVRTLDEAKNINLLLKNEGLERSQNLKVIMMCEIPSNVILMDEFSEYFDGFSIGSNDLTQLTIAVDRDSNELSTIFKEDDPSVKKMIQLAIEKAHNNNKFISICGQAPSNSYDFIKFLIDNKIDSISLNPDSVIPFYLEFAKS